MTDNGSAIVRVEDWLELMPELTSELSRSPEEVQLDIARRILAASTADEVLADDELQSARDLVGRSLILRGAKFNRSAFHDGGPPVYAVIDAVDEVSGEVLTFTCGATNVLMQLIRLTQLDALAGRAVRIKESRPNDAGHTVLKFVGVAT